MDLGKADHVYALLADGTTVEIRPAGPGDFDAVKAMHEQMSPDNTYMRFFNVSRLAAEEEARRICRAPGANHGALLALCGEEIPETYKTDVPAAAAVSDLARILELRESGENVAFELWESEGYVGGVPAEDAQVPAGATMNRPGSAISLRPGGSVARAARIGAQNSSIGGIGSR